MSDQQTAARPRANLVLALLLLAYIFNFLDRQILGILLEPIKAELNFTDSELGILTRPSFALVYSLVGEPLAVLADRTLQWLGTESEKVEYFTRATRLRPSELPLLKFGEAPDETIRWFPYKLPIGINGDGRTHVFLYLVTRKSPVEFRTFRRGEPEVIRLACRGVRSSRRPLPG